MDGGASAGAILGMKLFLPKPDRVRGRGGRKTEQGFEALGPGDGAGGYSPNPNSIMRSFGSERKMLRDFIRAARRVSRNFMGLVGHCLLGPVVVGSFIGLNFGR